ncbi:MAG: hypothetical protein NC123_15330 [Butyrivibrio sp.]|nr:hypothetical protein [Butyrivibrio sp.]
MYEEEKKALIKIAGRKGCANNIYTDLEKYVQSWDVQKKKSVRKELKRDFMIGKPADTIRDYLVLTAAVFSLVMSSLTFAFGTAVAEGYIVAIIVSGTFIILIGLEGYFSRRKYKRKKAESILIDFLKK